MRLRQTHIFCVLFIITLILIQTNIVLDQNLWRATRITLVMIEMIVVILGLRRFMKLA